jgi:transketolase C-terminal domain/subunit
MLVPDVNAELDQDATAAATTFFEVAVRELVHQVERDCRIEVLVQHDLMEHFLAASSSSDQMHRLSSAARPEEMRRTLAWCRRLVEAGRRPYLVLDDDCLAACFGQLREEFCISSLSAKLIVVAREDASGGGVSEKDGARPTLAFLRLLPNTIIVSPKDGRELAQMLRFAAGHDGPVALQVPRGPLPEMHFPDFVDRLELAKAEMLEEGDEVLLLALGALVAPAVAAAEKLSQQGISAGVVNARFVEPLDRALIGELARGTKGILTLEEEATAGGFGSAVLELLADSGIITPVTVSGAVGIHRNGQPEEELVRQIVDQSELLVDRANAALAPAERSWRRRRQGKRPDGVDLFGFSAESLERERELVKARRLSPEVEAWFSVYSLAGERRRFLWQWCEQGAELTTLPCVPAEFFAHVCQTKVLSIMLCVLLDDVADQRDRETFLEVLLKIVDGQLTPDLSACTEHERHYAEITRRLAEMYFARIRNYPCYETYSHLLRYDQFQYFNTMRYSQMLNRNLWLMNPVEHDLYLPHAMDMMSFATLDLMCLPAFPIDELGRLREALWHLQCMGRVGNLLSTWRREIHQQDFTSGVFAKAVIEGDLSIGQLRPDNYGEIEEAIVKGGHERYYFGRWKYHRECFLVRSRHVTAVDLHRLLEGNDRFFLMHLGGRGLI